MPTILETKDLQNSLKIISTIVQKEPPYNLITLSSKDGLEILAASPYSYAKYKIPCEINKEFSFSVDAIDFISLVNGINGPTVNVSFALSDKKINFSDKKSRKLTLRLTHEVLKKPNLRDVEKIQGFRLENTGVEYLVSTAKNLLNVANMMGMGFSKKDCYIISNSGEQAYFGKREDIYLGNQNFEIPTEFLSSLTYLPDITEGYICSSGIILKNKNLELYIPRLNNEKSQIMQKGATRLKKALMINSDIDISLNYQELIQDLNTASKLRKSNKEETILDIQIKENIVKISIPNAFESEISCETEGYKENEYSNFGISLRSFIGCIRQIQKSEDRIIAKLSRNAGFIRLSSGENHIILGLSKTSKGVRKIT